MKRVLVYRVTSGEILSVIEFPSGDLDAADYPGCNLLEVPIDGPPDTRGYYVVGDGMVPRLEMPVTQNGLTLQVPLGTEFFVTGPASADGVTEDGEIEFVFAEPGEYRVRLVNFPYQDAEVILES